MGAPSWPGCDTGPVSKEPLQAPRGTRDFYPANLRVRNWLFAPFLATAPPFTFSAISAPLLAHAERCPRTARSHRFRPTLVTTLTTIAGLLPMAMGLSGGSKVFGPFAAAIVFGLAVASGLTLFVVPSLYLALEDAGAWFRGLPAALSRRFASETSK